MSRTKQPKLKPCPFCGATPILYYNSKPGPLLGIGLTLGILPMIVCKNCGATTSFAGCETSGEDAVRVYNTRVKGGS